MSESLPPNGSGQMELELMSSQAGSLVRISASPGKARASTARARAFGRKWPVSLPNSDPFSQSLRTFLASELSALTGCSLIWKRTATPASRWWWVLSMPEHPTVDSELGLWPTPNVPNGGRSVAHVDEWRGKTPYHRGKKVQLDLAQAVKLWPPPHANCSTGNGPLNPEFVEWLMGYQIGFTDLERSEIL